MPNHVTNKLTIKGDEDTVRFIFKVISGDQENQFIDFNKVIPAPAFMFNQPAGKAEGDMAESLGCPIWTKFNHKEWGTKWNAYSQKKIDDYTIMYDTAWSSSRKVVQKIAEKFPMVEVLLSYADEDVGYNCGSLHWRSGEIHNAYTPEGGSHEALGLYVELNPDCDFLELVDGKYKYIED